MVTPPPPPPQQPGAQQLRFFKLSECILKAGKTALKAENLPQVKTAEQVGRVVTAPVETGFGVEVESAQEAASIEVQVSAATVDD